MKYTSPVATLLLFLVLLASSALADRADNVKTYNFDNSIQDGRASEYRISRTGLSPTASPKSQVGSVSSFDEGIGRGVSVGLTYDDAQNFIGWGRHISHWWNGQVGSTAGVSVHFGFRVDPFMSNYGTGRVSGYNVYDATADPGYEWPLTEEGDVLQDADDYDYGLIPSLAVMDNGRVVLASGSSHFDNGFLGSGAVYKDNMLFYQEGEFECDYTYGVDAITVDSLTYRPNFIYNAAGNYSRDPIIETQWDGANTIVHLLLVENEETVLGGDSYCNELTYRSAVYFRKVGTGALDGTWGNPQVIDSIWFPWLSMAAAPYPYQGVAIAYTNPGYYGALLNEGHDLDVWCRESPDRGLTWGTAYDITNYTNPIANDPNHFAAWLETQCLFTTDGDLQVIWTAKETSADPYFDGFNWVGWFQNVYHWSKSSGVVSEVARGTYQDYSDLFAGCNFSTDPCGYGSLNAGTVANINISECDGKLFCIWNQIHERAREGWCQANTEIIPGTVDDCAYTDNRLARANWEIFMSVTSLDNTALWDVARNITQTYTPGCGLVGDPQASGPCGDEYKPMVERYGFDEAGLDVTWPAEAVYDLTPDGLPAYDGDSYLNMQYVDDQFPGPSDWGSRTTDPRTLNSIKWIRLACVDPVYEPRITVTALGFTWPYWIHLGQMRTLPVYIANNGNADLHITDIALSETTGSGWLSASETPTDIDPLIIEPRTDYPFELNVHIDATSITTPIWLDGQITITSDALEMPTVEISIHLLVAEDVEPIVRDTVQTHTYMFNDFFYPEGECVALAVSNHGEMGYSSSGNGSVNLDYVASVMECGTRIYDAYYLQSGSAFVITADDAAGTNALVTSSYNLPDQEKTYSWNPTSDLGTMAWGEHLGPSSAYDSAYTGRIVNRDTTIAIERTYYAPRSSDPSNEIIDFVIAVTKLYSADGAAHNHVTLGDVYDWNVPSDSVYRNNTLLSSEELVYFVGTDTAGAPTCQSNETRFAAAVFGGGWDASLGKPEDICDLNNRYDFYGCSALPQHLLEDTAYYRDGTPLVPAQPNPQVWWDETSVAGLTAADQEMQNSDQSLWMTYRYDYSLGANDTLVYWVILTTVRNGDLEQLESQVLYAADWFGETLFGCDLGGGGCCVGRVGDANGSGDDQPTIGDISAIIDAKFISETCEGMCISEADVNQSGGCDPTCDDVTIGDIIYLVDRLFINTECTPLNFYCLPECLPCNTPGWWN